MGDTTLRERVKVIKELLGLFRLERMVYVIVTLVSVIILLTCAVVMLLKNGETVAIIGLFGGSGGILYTTGRLLKMWSDALGMLGAIAQEGGE